MVVKNEIVGLRFGRLTVLEKTKSKTGSHYLYKVICDCGMEKLVLKSNLRFGKSTSCGCLHKEQLSEYSKHRHATNRLERTITQSPLKRPRKNRFLTDQVFKRDSYTCQLCFKTGGVLNAHHIIRWADCPALRETMSNVITLCYSCHLLAHDKNLKTGLNLEIQKQLLNCNNP